MAERITQDICIDLREPCCDGENSIVLNWINTLGGLETWQFECLMRSTLETVSVGKFERYFPEISVQREREIELKKEGFEKYICAALAVKKEDVLPLSEIFYSPFVTISNPQGYPDGDYRVKILPETQQYKDSSAGTINFEFKFIMPKLFTVQN